jgi:hypothetical protein
LVLEADTMKQFRCSCSLERGGYRHLTERRIHCNNERLEWFLEALRPICPLSPFLDTPPIRVPEHSYDFTLEGRNRQEFGLFEPRSVFNGDKALQLRR